MLDEKFTVAFVAEKKNQRVLQVINALEAFEGLDIFF